MNIFSYIVGAGFGGDWMVDFATILLDGISNCCATVIEALSTKEPTDFIKSDITNTISAAATTIATLLVVIELCTQAMGFHFDDINDAVRFGFKVVVYKIIIENSSKIVDLVYGIFVDSGTWETIATSIRSLSGVFDTTDFQPKFNAISLVGELLGIKQFFLGLILFIISIVACGVLIKIMTAIAGLLFELAINIAIAPIPIATLVNSQTRGIGIGFIKNFAGNCMTLMMYTVCFAVYEGIKTSIQSAFISLIPTSKGDFLLFSGLIGSLVSIILLSVAIKNVSAMISKILS